MAMYFIHGLLEKRISCVPSSIPPWLLEQAGANPASAEPEDSLARAFRAHFWSLRTSADLYSAALPRAVETIADHYFDILDAKKTGSLSGETAVPFMFLSRLSAEELSHIW